MGDLYGKSLPAGASIGESLELSALPGQESAVSRGSLEGRGLLELLSEYGSALVGEAVTARYGQDFPVLIKLIDAQDDLSIQVHPDDAYARAHDLGVFGKTEAWVILHSDGGRIALGLQAGVRATDLAQAIAAGQAQQVVRFQPVSAGDVVYLPAGTIHALCKGVLIYEVQQSSDITFRLYDYDRAGLDGRKRDLHVEDGIAVSNFSIQPEVGRLDSNPGVSHIIDAEYFRLTVVDRVDHTLESGASFAAITVTQGNVTLTGDNDSQALAAGESALIPAGRQVVISTAPGGGRCLVATPTI